MIRKIVNYQLAQAITDLAAIADHAVIETDSTLGPLSLKLSYSYEDMNQTNIEWNGGVSWVFFTIVSPALARTRTLQQQPDTKLHRAP